MLNKYEVDVTSDKVLAETIELAGSKKCAAIIVPPHLVSSALMMRNIRQYNFKVLSAIDWPEGKSLDQDKFKNVSKDSLAADGYEILLTACKTPSDSRKEIKSLSKLFKDFFNPLIEMRFVLGFGLPGRTNEHFKTMCETFKSIPAPTMVRTSHLLTGKDDPKAQIAFIRGLYSCPIKVSGSVNPIEGADKYGISLAQLKLLTNKSIADKLSKK